VKTVKFNHPSYIGDPVNAIKIYNEKEVDELILVDISATIENKPPSFSLITEIADECFMPLCYGGSIRSLEDVKKIFSLGVEKVAINSYAAENPQFIKRASEMFGSQSIIISMDVRKSILGSYTVYTNSGKKSLRLDPVSYARKMEGLGAGEILLNSIDRDGTWEGYDVDLLKKVTDAVSIPVIALGGAGRIDHFSDAVKSGASACAIGSMAVYQGKNKGVLINFPLREEIEKVLGEQQ
jgi:cyclase